MRIPLSVVILPRPQANSTEIVSISGIIEARWQDQRLPNYRFIAIIPYYTARWHCRDLISAAKSRGYSAIALTDTNVVYGLVEFYRQAKAAGLKPLLGMQIAIDDAKLLVIAKNNQGYHQLLKISTQIMLATSPVAFADLLPLTG